MAGLFNGLDNIQNNFRSYLSGEKDSPVDIEGIKSIASKVRVKPNTAGYDLSQASPSMQGFVRRREERAEERREHVYGKYLVELDGHLAQFTCYANRIEITPPVSPGLRRGTQLLFGIFSPNNAIPDYDEIFLSRVTLKITHPTLIGKVIILHYRRQDHKVRMRPKDAQELIYLIRGHARF